MQYIPQVISTGASWLKTGLDAVGGIPGALSLGGSALSAFSGYSSGLADKAEYEKQAAWETLGATTEILRGRQTENEVLDNLLDTIAKQRVAFGASGVDPFIGTPAAVTRDSVQRGETAGRIAMNNAKTGWFERRQRAAAYRDKGKASKSSGLSNVAGTILGAVGKVLERGSPPGKK